MDLNICKLRYDLKRMRSNNWGYTIIPTFACNLSCTYCYEKCTSAAKKHNEFISDSVINEIVTFISTNSINSKDVSILWYGGEPLICANQIIRSSLFLKEVLEKIDVKFSGGIVTNGILLTQKIARDLVDSEIKSFQLTFDGAEYEHNRLRKYKNGNPTYHLVLQALECLPEKSSASIRVHLHEGNNIENLKQLFVDISKTKSKCRKTIYFTTVHPLTTTCASIAESAYGAWIPQNTAFQKIASLIRVALELGLSIHTGTNTQFICGAVSRNSLVIEPDGTLKKCWNEVGNPDLAIGTIRKPVEISENNMNLVNWLTYDPVAMTDSECHACEWFERCYGGCPYMVRKGVKKPHRCHPCKGLIEEFLPKLVDELRSEGIGTYDAESGLIIPTKSKTSTN